MEDVSMRPPASSRVTALTLVDLCRGRAAEEPDRRVYSFMENGQDVTAELTYGELDRRARAIAAHLVDLAPPGSRALLSYLPGLDFHAAFYGCLYAGMVAVPVAPLDGSRNGVKRDRLDAIAANCSPRLLLGTQRMLGRVDRVLRETPRLAALTTVATDEIDPDAARRWQAPETTPDAVAYLQYSSGSTGVPKGVVLSHANVMDNLALIYENGRRAVDGDVEDRPPPPGVCWLPLFHDMGLVGGVLEPLHVGYEVVFMPALAFIQQPVNWLRAISDLDRAISGAPNFAYEHCVRRVSERQAKRLDLSGWEIAAVGAEPIRPDTVNRFCDRFEPFGFRREAFFPGYGLAESTVMVSGGPVHQKPLIEAFDRDALAGGRVLVAEPGTEKGRELVGCGQIQSSITVVLTHPQTGQPCGPDEVGEVLVSGASVGRGYWNAPEETERTFHARVPGYPDQDFLRTGDLGFVHQDQLFVTGRAKDVVIIDGLNHYPQDIEATAWGSHAAIREGCCCAFGIDDGERERLVVLAEINLGYRVTAAAVAPDAGTPDARTPAVQLGRAFRSATTIEVMTAVRRAVSADHGVQVHEVVLLRSGTLPFTSSAKIQRRESLARYRSGAFAPSVIG